MFDWYLVSALPLNPLWTATPACFTHRSLRCHQSSRTFSEPFCRPQATTRVAQPMYWKKHGQPKLATCFHAFATPRGSVQKAVHQCHESQATTFGAKAASVALFSASTATLSGAARSC
jgi:hypothetical protein